MSRRSRLISATVVAGVAGALLAVTGTSYADTAPTPGAAGLGDRLYPSLGNGGYDVRDYDLRLVHRTKDPKQTVAGDVTIVAEATQNLSRFNLDFAGGDVGAVSVNGRPARFTREGSELIVTPWRFLPAGRRFTVTVSGFTATPAPPADDSMMGFLATPDGTVLAGQPAASQLLFPNNNHPRDKATYTVTLTVPQGWTGTASGVPRGTRTANGFVSATYRQAQPMASELLQVAVGDFVVHSRPPVGRTAVRDVVPRRLAAELLPRLEQERAQLVWMEGKVGAYPFDNYGSLVVEAELGGALETQTLSLYDTGLFALPDAYGAAAIMTHELAHHWFGDSVSPWAWTDIWLNEGHAHFYELMHEEEAGTFDKYGGMPDRQAYFKAVYTMGNRFRAEHGPVGAPKDSTSFFHVFNPNVYQGGALVLYALQEKIGAATFERLERSWLSAFRGKSASSQDFIALASRVAGEDLGPFLTGWLYGTTIPPMPGHPDWTAT
ncbi:zinc metalloprotease [Virgisporangium aliadipatigenens]|uniref:Aminopeptidase N n=1 Tax=Virgisporangium aliadipatigenens TaxID=741659 RepID=A0A8J4DPR0_9ACTN|nr:M1 family metallopeptidase [Virgisporangium aliadipatigenens]GIJ46225.1 zinc metalloprotease [Virgisporangium aliadipatigenens]